MILGKLSQVVNHIANLSFQSLDVKLSQEEKTLPENLQFIPLQTYLTTGGLH